MSSSSLLVTYNPNHKKKAEDEVAAILTDLGEQAETEEVWEGVFLAYAKDSRRAIGKLREMQKKDPTLLNCTSRWIPIDIWISSDIEEMKKTLKKFNDQIEENESWKLEIHKREFDMKNSDLVRELTSVINKPKVDMKTPDVIINVEIFKDKTALSLLRKDELLKVSKKV